MQLHSRLVHAEPQIRVVEVVARDGDRLLGRALGEAAGAEEAEDRAIARLLQRLAAAGGAAAALPPVVPPVLPAAAEAAGPAATAAPAAVTTPPPARPIPAPAAASAAADPVASSVAAPAVAPPGAAGSANAALPVAVDPAAPPPPAAAAPAVGSVAAPAAAATPTEPPPDPEDWSAELAQIELQLRRIGWDRDAESTYLQRAFGHPSRSRITTYADLMGYLRGLEGLAPAADAAAAPVPLRRRDLLSQSQQLLDQLGWGPEDGRRFLAEHLGAASRQQLSDHQLLQFNMLLESELIAAADAG